MHGFTFRSTCIFLNSNTCMCLKVNEATCVVFSNLIFFILYFIYLYKLNTKYNYMKYGLLELCAAKGSSED